MADQNEYDEGELVRLSGHWRAPNQDTGIMEDTDPDTPTVIWRSPNGTVTSLTYLVDAGVVRDDVGRYHYDVVVDQPGQWFYRWKGEGGAKAAKEKGFYVKRSNIAT